MRNTLQIFYATLFGQNRYCLRCRLVIIFLIPSFAVSAQELLQDTVLEVEKNEYYTIQVPVITAIALQCNSCELKGAYVINDRDTISVFEDPHKENTALVLLAHATPTIRFFSGEIEGPLRFYFISAGTVAFKKKDNLRRLQDPCALEVISPEAWRSGLPPPTATPSIATVQHIVVHHSATSNTISDPYAAVRSVYTYHTQVNGWSDIGYNYLIAPDGTVFQGRDDQGIAEPDHIVGAHMCGVNTGTMGVCLLGTFTNTLPDERALRSLENLVAIKAEKENISILGSTPHRIGPPSADLPAQPIPNICGHRDGCRPSYTECPGDQLYLHLATIKENALIRDCEADEEQPQLLVFPNPTNKWINTNFAWYQLEIFDMKGILVKSFNNSVENKISANDLASGVYVFSFSRPGEEQLIRKIIIQ